jgi:hypothetical protein
MIPVIETRGLSRRYGWVAAQSDCSSTVPRRADVRGEEPDGAGRLRLRPGRPSAKVAALSGTPRQVAAFLAGTGFLAQETGRTSARLTELAEAVRSR